MKQLFPSHESAVTRGLSPRLWNLVPLDEIFLGPNNLDAGYGIFENFGSVATDATNKQLRLESGGAEYYISSSSTVLQLGGDESSSVVPGANGVLRMFNTANDEGCAVQLCGVAGEPFFVSDTYGTTPNARDLIFEARIRASSITVNDHNLFVGLAECAMAAAVDSFFSTGNPPVINHVGHIGFHRDEDTPTYLDWVYGANGQGELSKKDNLLTLAIDTWYKVGFRYYAGSGVVTPFVNGVPYAGDRITTANIEAAAFPDAEGLAPLFSTVNGTADDETMDIDWIACAQVEAIG